MINLTIEQLRKLASKINANTNKEWTGYRAKVVKSGYGFRSMLVYHYSARAATICQKGGIMCIDKDLYDRLYFESVMLTQVNNVQIHGMWFSVQDQINIILKHAARNGEIITGIDIRRDGVVFGFIKTDGEGQTYTTVSVILQISEESKKGYYAYSL